MKAEEEKRLRQEEEEKRVEAERRREERRQKKEVCVWVCVCSCLRQGHIGSFIAHFYDESFQLKAT